jgi:hypothetical protein
MRDEESRTEVIRADEHGARGCDAAGETRASL